MAALVCEICGGKIVGKPGGLFECDSCGMEYTKEWAQEKVQEIKGTVQVEGKVDVSGSTVLAVGSVLEMRAIEEKNRYENYWKTHQNERTQMLKEQKDLKKQVEALIRERTDAVNNVKKEKQLLPDNEIIKNKKSQKEHLQSEFDSLGLFKGKEKRALQEQIDLLDIEIEKINVNLKEEKKRINQKADKVYHSFDSKINPLNKRIREIEREINKKR